MLMSECVSVCVHECMCVCVIIEILALGKITKVTRFNLPSSLACNSIITIWKHLPSNSLRRKWGKKCHLVHPLITEKMMNQGDSLVNKVLVPQV